MQLENTGKLSRAARKKVKRQRKEEEQQKREERHATKRKKKSVVKWSLIALGSLAVIAFFVFIFSGAKVTSYSKGPIHWHSQIRVFTCDIPKTLPAPASNVHLGKPLLHTHDDRLIHVEGEVWKPEDITLGEYMKVIGRTFTNTALLDKENGDLCNGKPGKVKLLVDGKENEELAAYVVKDKEEYEVRFE